METGKKRRVLVTGALPEHLENELSAGVELKKSSGPASADELVSALSGCDGVICYLSEQMSAAAIEKCGDLKVISNVAVGYDNVDVDAATAAGILLTNTPGVLDETTADLAFGLIISCARRIAEADRFARARLWQGWEADLMLGVDVFGKTLGIVGFGRIGKAVARRALGFGMKVQYANRSGKNEGGEFAALKRMDLYELLSSSDFISLNCPLNKETFHLIGEKELSSIKPGAFLINTARGAVVDQPALVSALSQGRLAGAGLDVFEDEPNVPHELLSMNNVVITPHIGSATVETRTKMAALAVSGMLKALSGELPPNAVNPAVWEKFVARLS